MKKKTLYSAGSILLLFVAIIIMLKFNLFHAPKANNNFNTKNDSIFVNEIKDTIEIINQTFLGNDQHNFYGDSAPAKLNIIWKKHLGSGKTWIGNDLRTWSGAGWTGQPLMVKEEDKKYIIQGSYSHKLRKIDAETGEFIWEYSFDDVLKGTGTIWRNKNAENLEEKFVIMQGSRKGINTSGNAKVVPSFRAVSYFTGKELWRYNSVKTRSYSRDVDGSAIVINDTAYIGLENAKFLVFDPNYKHADTIDGIIQPHVFEEHKIYDDKDPILHGGNLVTEASVTRLKNRIYIASGAGHVYGYNLKTRKIDWDFFTGSDIDGTPVVTHDSCLLVAIEKEYIKGQGGVFKLNPDFPPDSAVVWYFPTGNKHSFLWYGGIIGSATVNTIYGRNIAAFTAIDDYFYVVDQDSITGETVLGPNFKKVHQTPKTIFKYQTGSAIATPIIVKNRIIVTTYKGIYLFEFDQDMNFKLLDKFEEASFEATPFVDNGRIYIASRNGFLYCLGEK